jgi:hypothetical protein
MTSGGRLKKTSVRARWRDRLAEMLVAGGTLAAVGCSSSANETKRQEATTVPCGDADLDPCSCDKSDEAAVLACARKTACEARGSDFVYGGGDCYEPDYWPYDAGPNPPDASVFTIPCGDANADPCLCDPAKTDPVAAGECKNKMACEAKGGAWGYSTPEGPCLFPDGGSDSGPLDAGFKD